MKIDGHIYKNKIRGLRSLSRGIHYHVPFWVWAERLQRHSCPRLVHRHIVR